MTSLVRTITHGGVTGERMAASLAADSTDIWGPEPVALAVCQHHDQGGALEMFAPNYSPLPQKGV